jgi:predicted metal-dependent peptidase
LSTTDYESILDEVTRTSIRFLLEEPFYGHLFSGMLREVNHESPTMGVRLAGKQMVKLVINPDYWQEDLKLEAHRYGILKHEILHIVFRHMTAANRYPFKRLFNIAADLVVNQYIEAHQLPGEPITLETFPHLKLKPFKDLNYYYHKLLEEVEQRMDEKDSNPKGGRNRQGHGKQADRHLLDQLLKDGHPDLERHRNWDEFDKLSAPERKLLDHATREAITRSVQRVKDKGQGAVPSGLEEYLGRVLKEGTALFDWRRVLRLFASSSSRTRLSNTIRRPSKRYGTTPGIQVKRKQKILVALDTSASIGEEELKTFFTEIDHLWRHGGEVRVVECDTRIQRNYLYTGIPPLAVKGRGGTAFEAPIAYANQSYRPDALVYFTDGFGPIPETPSRQPLLWVINPQGIKPEDKKWQDFPGRKVKMIG